MARRINERNTGNWSLESEPKTRKRISKTTRSFTENEIVLFEYLLGQIQSDLVLNSDDIKEQVYRDTGNILVQFRRDDIDDFRILINKFKQLCIQKVLKKANGMYLLKGRPKFTRRDMSPASIMRGVVLFAFFYAQMLKFKNNYRKPLFI